MAESPFAALGRRSPPGAAWSFSAIGWDLGSGAAGRGATDRLPSVALLRRARGQGVTTFDLGRSRPSEMVETLLGEAFPDPDDELVTILPHRAPPSAPGESARSRDRSLTELRADLGAARHRLRGAGQLVIDWQKGDPAVPTPGPSSEEAAVLRNELAVLGWTVPGNVPGGVQPPALGCGPISLLESSVPRALGFGAPTGTAWIARDPLAGGRLDGTAFARPVLGPRSPGPPTSLRALEAEFAAVRPFGFLTAGTGRTLAQAALRFALAWPWVVTVSVPFPSPDRLAEIAGTVNAPPLSATELDRVLSLAPSVSTGEPS